MQTYELTVRGRSISASPSNRTLVRTSIGVDQIHVLFDSTEWLEFPIEVTFGQGDDKVTQPVVMSAIQGSQDWAAETTATVPWEVVDGNGSIAVTFQGTDSQGRHLITAKGAPLRVTEAGDVVAGDEPSDAPSVSQWQQAYADAMAAVNQAASLVANLQQSLESMVSEAEGAISSAVEEAEQSIGGIQPATAESLGVVRIGEGIDVDQNGVISTSGGSGMTDAQRTDLARLKSLSAAMADATYSGSSVTGSPKVKPSALPVANVTTPGAVIPDGTTIRVDQYGMIHSYVGEIDPATVESIGGVKPDGTTITIEEDGTIHGVEQTPIATTSTAGKVKPDGETITVESDGTIHGTEQTPIATTAVAGKVKPDGTTITIDQDGTIHGTEQTQIATTSLAGKVKPDGTTITVEEDGTIHGVEQIATVAAVGSVKPDGTTITVDADGTIHGTEQTPVATVGVAGKVKPDGTTITVQRDGTISSATLPDWDENDSSDPAYIANRPFYEVHEHEVIVDGYFAEPMSFEPRERPNYVEYDVPGNGYLFMGETYRVTMSDPSGVYSGTNEFECGYYGIDGTINGNRFYIESHTGWGKLRLYSFRNSGDIAYFGGVTVTVERFHTETTKLPSKYVPIASASSIGGIMPDGTTTTVSSDGTLHSVSQTPIATTQTAGVVKPDGTTITIDDGVISSVASGDGSGYVLPAASTSQLGGVKVDGTTITADQDGTIHGNAQVTVDAEITHSGANPVRGSAIYSALLGKADVSDVPTKVSDLTNDSGFVSSVPTATTSSLGVVKPDGTTITIDDDGTMHADAAVSVPIATADVAGRVKPDGKTLTVSNDGTLKAIYSAIAPLYFVSEAYSGQKFIELRLGKGLTNSSGRLVLEPLSAASEVINGINLGGLVGEGLTCDGLSLMATRATDGSPGIVKPDNETVFVSDGVISAKDYDAVIAALARRVAAIEEDIGLSSMSYENGTLYVNGTYENGTLMTGSSYQDGTLL